MNVLSVANARKKFGPVVALDFSIFASVFGGQGDAQTARIRIAVILTIGGPP